MTLTKRKRRNYLYAVGRRKTATASVRFTKRDAGGVSVLVNEKPLADCFNAEKVRFIETPFQLINDKINGIFSIHVSGGGHRAQEDAIRHGISRILIQIKDSYKALLKTQNLLTRDSRMKERKKPGLKRARRAPQWSKR